MAPHEVVAVSVLLGVTLLSIPIWVIASQLKDAKDHLFKVANMLSGIFMKLEHIKFELFSISSKLEKKNERGE
jgi:hypothetical protein